MLCVSGAMEPRSHRTLKGNTMSNISARTANWRLFGGGGLIVGGALLLVVYVLVLAQQAVPAVWLTVLAYLVIAVGLALVAFGETGSNGAVGNLAWGKIALVAAGIGFALYSVYLLALLLGALLPAFLVYLAVILSAVGLVLGAVAVQQKGVARGPAAFILFVPAAFAVLWLLGVLLTIPVLSGDLVSLGLALSFLVTGVLYLLNPKSVG